MKHLDRVVNTFFKLRISLIGIELTYSQIPQPLFRFHVINILLGVSTAVNWIHLQSKRSVFTFALLKFSSLSNALQIDFFNCNWNGACIELRVWNGAYFAKFCLSKLSELGWSRSRNGRSYLYLVIGGWPVQEKPIGALLALTSFRLSLNFLVPIWTRRYS